MNTLGGVQYTGEKHEYTGGHHDKCGGRSLGKQLNLYGNPSVLSIPGVFMISPSVLMISSRLIMVFPGVLMISPIALNILQWTQ